MTLGFLYIDGHTRAYFGTRDVQKMHIARMKHPGPGTEETWVTERPRRPDAGGDRRAVGLAGRPDQGPAPGPAGDVPGTGTTPVLCFDRGGWSPDLFADITDAGFGLLTYRKRPGRQGHPRRG